MIGWCRWVGYNINVRHLIEKLLKLILRHREDYCSNQRLALGFDIPSCWFGPIASNLGLGTINLIIVKYVFIYYTKFRYALSLLYNFGASKKVKAVARIRGIFSFISHFKYIIPAYLSIFGFAMSFIGGQRH